MIVFDRYIRRSRRLFGPRETDTPLIVDPDAVRSSPIAFQFFEPVPRKIGDIAQAGRGLQAVESLFGLPPESLELLDPLAFGKSFGSSVAVSQDHDDL
jgi:hypothetical protein